MLPQQRANRTERTCADLSCYLVKELAPQRNDTDLGVRMLVEVKVQAGRTGLEHCFVGVCSRCTWGVQHNGVERPIVFVRVVANLKRSEVGRIAIDRQPAPVRSIVRIEIRVHCDKNLLSIKGSRDRSVQPSTLIAC